MQKHLSQCVGAKKAREVSWAFGDDLIVSSIVKKAYAKHNKKICVGDSKVVWEEVFDHNPKMAREPYKGCVWVNNIMGNRPYIDRERSRPGKIVFNDYRVEPGEIFFHPSELRHDQKDFIYIEPNVKGTFSGNKDWGFEKWQQVVQRLPDLRFIQGKGRKLEGVEQVDTTSFRDAAALLASASLFVGTDGGLHHAAAALGIPAVVVWGGLAPPKVLGYPTHTNLHSGVNACGSSEACEHCKKALAWVTVDMVVKAIEEALNRIPATADS